jgi:hypothetical protein
MADALHIETNWTKARLTGESPSGYVFLAVGSGAWGPLPIALPSRRRRQLLGKFRGAADRLTASTAVLRADVFRAVLRPPGGDDGTDPTLPHADFDVVLLVETTTPESALQVSAEAVLTELRRELPGHLSFTGSNVRRIAPVDHSRPGVFLFNYFSARDAESNLQAWQYTAGWFQDETGLDNSTVIQPMPGAEVSYTLVNHCRWDHYIDVLPALIFTKSFHSFVLRVFKENEVAPHPILYALQR